MSITAGPGLAGPSVGRQVARATAGTFAALALVAAGIWGVNQGRELATSAWWQVVGDPDLVVADSVTLDSAAPTVVAPVAQQGSISFERDLATLAGPIGGGTARVVETSTDLLAAAPYAQDFEDAVDNGELAAILPSGVLLNDTSFGGPGITGALRFRGGPGAPVAATQEAQRALVTRLATEWRRASGTTVDIVVRPRYVPLPGQPQAGVWSIDLALPGCDVCVSWTSDVVIFDDAGRLQNASISTAAITGTRMFAVNSPAAAFEDVRHHRGDTAAEPTGSPVRLATLVVGDVAFTDVTPMWMFQDGNGALVATANAPA